MTVGNLIETLKVYPSDFLIKNENNETIKIIVNGDNFVLLSTKHPVGYSQAGEYAFNLVMPVQGMYVSPFEDGVAVSEDKLLPLKDRIKAKSDG